MDLMNEGWYMVVYLELSALLSLKEVDTLCSTPVRILGMAVALYFRACYISVA